MDFLFLAGTQLFQGLSPEEIKALLPLLQAVLRRGEKGEVLLLAGDTTRRMGLVLEGRVRMERDDVWGGRAILGQAGPGQVFGETYACIPGEPLMVSAVADQPCQVLFLTPGALFSGGPPVPRQEVLLQNLLTLTARKNLELSRRSFYASPKTIRGRLLAYLSDQALLSGGPAFSIPFDRQQLADYLEVDRSALSHELGKMSREGLLRVKKNRFFLSAPRWNE